MNVLDLVAKLTLDSKGYDKGLDDAEGKAGNFASKFKTGLGVAAKAGAVAITAVGTGVAMASKAFISGASQAAEYGDSIDKMSQKIGISAEAYQEWDFIAQHSGTSMESLKTSFKTLATSAQSSKGEFEKLGISLNDVKNMSTEELFAAVIKGLQNMEEGTERTAIASKLLGRGAIELGALLNMSAADTENMRQQVHDLGGVMSDEAVKGAARYQDSLQNMQTALTGMKNQMMGEFLPAMADVMDGLAKLFAGDGTGIQAVNQGVDTIVRLIAEGAPKVLEVGGQLISALASALIDNLPKIVEAATNVMMDLIKAFVEHLPEIVQAGIEVIGSLAKGIGEALPELIPAAIEAIITVVETLIENADKVIEGAFALIEGLFEGLIRGIPRLIQAIPEIIVKLITAIIENAPKFVEAAIQLVFALAQGLIEGIPQLLSAIPEVIGAILNAFGEVPGQILEIGKSIVEGLWNGITSMAGWIWDQITGFFGGIVDGIKDFLGIHSPSRVFAQLGEFSAEGFGEGFEDTMGDVKDDIADSMSFDAPDVNLGNISYGTAAMNIPTAASMSVLGSDSTTNILNAMLDKLDNLNMNQQIVLDTGVLVGQTVNKMDSALGALATKNARRVYA